MDATSSVQTQLNAKQATITGAATTIASADLTVSRALQSNASGKVEVSSVTTTELGYVSGVTSALQTQLNAKQATIDSSNRLNADLIHDGSVSNTEFGYINSLTSNAQTQLDAKAPISQPEFTSYVDFDSILAPGAPSDSGDVRLYANSSKLYFQGQGDGSPTEIGSGGGAGDADTIQLKAANDFSAVNVAPWYTGNNPVPGGGGSIGGTWEISTSNPLINIDGKTNVFHYSNGTSNRKNDYFEIELDIPNYAKGHNLVLQLFYRTVGAEDTDFLFFARDRTADYETTTSSSGALNTITLASATGFAVGDRICIQDSSDARHFRYVTAVSGSDITFSGSAITVGSGDVVISKYFTDELDTIAAENNTTNYEGKIRKWAFQINDTTTKIRVGFIYNNTATSTNELFFDQILLSSNQFLQTSSQGHTETYITTNNANFWKASGSTTTWNTTNIAPMSGTPTLTNSKLIQISDVSGSTRIIARQDIVLDVGFLNNSNSNAGITCFDSTGEMLATQYATTAHWITLNAEVTLKKNDWIRFSAGNNANYEGGITINATPLVSDCILVSSQDEIWTDWIAYTPSFTGFGTATNVSFFYKRNGDSIDIRGSFAAGTCTSDIAQVSLPSGLSLDFGKLNPTEARDQYGTIFIMGSGASYYSNTSGAGGIVVLDYSFSNSICFSSANVNGTQTNIMTGSSLTGSGLTQMIFAKNIPIAGYSSTFNPVLSMPLVEYGGDIEEYRAYQFQEGSSVNYRARMSGTLLKNTVSTLGTVTNDSSYGWYFAPNQRVKVNISWSQACSTTAAGLCVVKYPSSFGTPSTVADANSGNSAWDPYRVTGIQDTNGAGYQGNVSSSFIAEAGDYIQLAFENTNWQTSAKSLLQMTVEKVYSNTSLAHIIKPAVCILKNVLAYNAGGGSTATGDWNKCPLNTVEGESWFVTLNDSTDVFTLSPGMYELDAVQPLVRPNRCQVVIFDEDNSNFVVAGTSNYFDNSNVGCGEASLKGVFTITTSTQFSFRYRVTNDQSGTGLGEPLGETSPPLSVYAQIKIRKLK